MRNDKRLLGDKEGRWRGVWGEGWVLSVEGGRVALLAVQIARNSNNTDMYM